jgi:hypothetical protein
MSDLAASVAPLLVPKVYLLNTRVSMTQLMRHPVHQQDLS